MLRWDNGVAADLVNHIYDGEGRRVSQAVGTTSPTITKYLLDIQPGLSVVLSETAGANTMRYVHSPRGIHAHKDTGGNWEWMVQDGLGSVREVVDNAVGVLESRNYDPYGNPFGATGTSQTGFGFTGELVDGSGLLDLRARRYNAGLGTFASLDPFEGVRDRAMSLNGYSWVEGNVPNAIDTNGLQSIAVPSSSSIFDYLASVANQCGGSTPCIVGTLGLATLAAILQLGITPAQLSAYQAMNAMLQKERDYTGNPPVAVPSTYPDKKLNEEWQKLEPSWMRPPNGNGPDWWKLLGLGLAVAAPHLFRILVERICWGCLGSNQPSPAPVATPDYKPTATPTPTPTPNQLPIIVDFGVGTNVKEIQAILSARPNHKLVVIEDGDDQMRLLGLMLQPLNISSDRLEVISGDYSDPNILNGRKADEAFSIYPNPDARNKVAPAAHNHLHSGGKFYMVTELRLSYQEIYAGLSPFMNFDDKWTRTVDKGGVSRTEIEAGRNGPNIPFTSFYGVAPDVYDIWGTYR